MKHELKILPPYFNAIDEGLKNFEIRKDGRGFQKGDDVLLLEWDSDPEKIGGGYTGRSIEAKIGYVTGYEQKKGFVVFALKQIQRIESD